MKPFYVLRWDFNKDTIVPYDIMRYLKDTWDEEKKRGFRVFSSDGEPETFESFKKFILSASQYQFRAKCEYEMICHGWPVEKNEYKLDVYKQIEFNIDAITTHFMQNL